MRSGELRWGKKYRARVVDLMKYRTGGNFSSGEWSGKRNSNDYGVNFI